MLFRSIDIPNRTISLRISDADLAERQRQVLVNSRLLKVDGRWEAVGDAAGAVLWMLVLDGFDFYSLHDGVNTIRMLRRCPGWSDIPRSCHGSRQLRFP